MKTFLGKKWGRLPIGIIGAVMAVLLIATSVFAAYGFLTFTTAIQVDEPMLVEYNLNGQYGGDTNWHTLGDIDSLTLARSAGDNFDMYLRITNSADNALTVDTVISGTGKSYFTFAGFPTALSVPNGTTGSILTHTTVDNDAPPGTYNITFTFTRS